MNRRGEMMATRRYLAAGTVLALAITVPAYSQTDTLPAPSQPSSQAESPQAAKRRVHKLKLGFVADHPYSMTMFSSLTTRMNSIFWDTSGDVICNTAEFIPDGEPVQISTSLPQTIESEADFLAYASSPHSVHIVDAIRWCGGPGARIIGCARKGGPVLVVDRPDLDQLTVHEIGHAQDLDHMDEFPTNIMYPMVLPESRQLLAFQCKRYSSGQLYPALASAEAPMPPSQPQPQRAEEPTASRNSVQQFKRDITFEEFMSAAWTHFDLATARIEKMSDAEIEKTRDFIKDNKYRYWPNSINVIGLRGNSSDLELFRKVLNTKDDDQYVREAKLNLPRAASDQVGSKAS